MDAGTIWTITRKDLSIFRTKRGVFYSTILLPLILSLGLPMLIYSIEQRGTIPEGILTALLNAFSFIFVIFASVITTAISSYSIIGEKVEKSLEPLLASPASDGEILMAKSLVAFLPALIATYIGLGIYMTATDLLTVGQIGYLYFPNWNVALMMLVVTPLAILMSVGANIMVSSRVNDIRTAYQIGVLMVAPLSVFYVGSEIGAWSIDTTSLLLISAILAVLDVALFYLCKATFQREEILTKWR
jgi:ABC-2 type transport system permease protein